MWAKRALGPLSKGSKDHGTQNTLIFSDWNFMVFQSRKNIVLLSLRCGKLKGLRELVLASKASKWEVHFDTKPVGRTRFPICLM